LEQIKAAHGKTRQLTTELKRKLHKYLSKSCINMSKSCINICPIIIAIGEFYHKSKSIE
jgi:hypothetical protein